MTTDRNECPTCGCPTKCEEGLLERAEAEVAELRQKLSDCELLLTDLGKTHTRVSGERDELRATVEHITELAFEHNGCSGCQTPWWLRFALDGGEQRW